MESEITTRLAPSRLNVKISRKDHSGEPFAENVLKGLSSSPKKLSPKFLYDARGSQLFEQICELPEYYPTRTEAAIIRKYADEIAGMCQKTAAVIELGSGSSTKTRLLIEAFLRRRPKLQYIPIDISKSILVQSARDLLRRYSKLRITALVSDYFVALDALKERQHKQKLILFLGSSIGNFEPDDAITFLRHIRETMNDQDMLLMGMDMAKSKDILIPAYDDASGVTADFNLNLLRRINNELGGNFDLSQFRHLCIFNEEKSRIEMHLQSQRQQEILVGQLNKAFSFEKNETIHTESSHKYRPEHIQIMARLGGFELETTWYDARKWFSLNLMLPKT